MNPTPEETTMRRRTMIGLGVALAGIGLTGAAAFARPPHWMGDGMMRRFASAAIDEALDHAQVTPEQRATIHATRDRLFLIMEAHGKGRPARLHEVLALFEGDTVDAGRLQALRQEIEAEHGRIADAVGQALGEVHDVLTPTQRKALTDYVRARRHPMH